MNITVENNENPSLCSLCGGSCCKRHAGFYHPLEVMPILLEFLDSPALGTTHQIDAYETATGQIYMLRPAHTNTRGIKWDMAWEGTCVNWQPLKGCGLTFEERPLQCRVLVPTEGYFCKAPSEYSGAAMAELWKPFQKYFND